MVKSISELGGRIRNLRRLPDPTDKTWSAFNPSIAQAPDGSYAILIRSSNYIINDQTGWIVLNHGHFISTRTWFSELDEDLNLVNLREVKFIHPDLPIRRGVEDARLFWREDGWHFSAVMLEIAHTKYARLAEYKLDPETNEATFLGKLETPTPTRPEKNWMAPSVGTEAFDYLYSTKHTYKDGELHETPDAPEIKGIRGGSGLLLQGDGTYLAVVHKVEIDETRRYNPRTFGYETITVRDYTHLFARYSASGRLLELSEEFIFQDMGIEYAAGLVEYGDDFVISFGKRDVSSHFAYLPKLTVASMLRPVIDSDPAKS